MGMSDNGELQDWIMLMLSAKLPEDHERFCFRVFLAICCLSKFTIIHLKHPPPEKGG